MHNQKKPNVYVTGVAAVYKMGEIETAPPRCGKRGGPVPAGDSTGRKLSVLELLRRVGAEQSH